eukprot:31529-Pelagococcus_subviridis.AAC.20
MMSVPSTTSRFSDDASMSCGRMFAGRRFANTPRPARRPRSPCSGRCSAGSVSHLYPPIAARRTASEAWHVASVSGGRGIPVASIAAPPTSASVKSNAMSCWEPTSTRHVFATAMISGPMPSPGRSVML